MEIPYNTNTFVLIFFLDTSMHFPNFLQWTQFTGDLSIKELQKGFRVHLCLKTKCLSVLTKSQTLFKDAKTSNARNYVNKQLLKWAITAASWIMRIFSMMPKSLGGGWEGGTQVSKASKRQWLICPTVPWLWGMTSDHYGTCKKIWDSHNLAFKECFLSK